MFGQRCEDFLWVEETRGFSKQGCQRTLAEDTVGSMPGDGLQGMGGGSCSGLSHRELCSGSLYKKPLCGVPWESKPLFLPHGGQFLFAGNAATPDSESAQ